MTNHDDNPTLLADRVATELQAMAAELDIAERSPETTVRIGQRRRRQSHAGHRGTRRGGSRRGGRGVPGDPTPGHPA